MFITLKIWVVIFTEFCIWSTPGNRLCILKQERHRRRLAKAKEKRYLELQRVPLINWKDFVLFYRGKQLMKNFIIQFNFYRNFNYRNRILLFIPYRSISFDTSPKFKSYLETKFKLFTY